MRIIGVIIKQEAIVVVLYVGAKVQKIGVGLLNWQLFLSATPQNTKNRVTPSGLSKILGSLA